MKLKGLTTACLLSIAALAACGGGDADGIVKNIKGGSKDEKEAIQFAIENMGPALMNGASLNTEDTFDANPDNGDYLLLATKIIGAEVNYTMYDIDIEWDIDRSSPYVDSVTEGADGQLLVDLNYPTDKDGSFSFGISKVSCGRAVSTDPEVVYNLNIKKPVYKHVDQNITALNKISENPVEEKGGEYGYDLIKYDQKSPYWVGNNPGTEKDYYYVNVDGELIYAAPDGNWALIGDGDQIMELYAGSAYDLGTAKYPALANKYVRVSGNMSQYNGNIQIGFITFIRNSKAENKKTASKTYQTIDETFLSALDTEYVTKDKDGKVVVDQKTGEPIKVSSQLQCVPGKNLSNALVQVTGTYVPGSLKADGKTTDQLKKGARGTFQIQVGSHKVTVAYDYHTDKDGSVGLCAKLNNAVKQNNPITIKGTYRYCCNDKIPFLQNYSNPGEWQVVPFLADHCAF